MKSLQITGYAILLFIATGCFGDEEVKCDNYLDIFSGTQVLYYSNGLASEYVFEEDTIARFRYTESGKLHTMSASDGFLEEYHYDETDRLDHIWRFYPTNPADSLAISYTSDNLIAEITYYAFDNLRRTEQYTYTGRNATQVIIQNVGFEPLTFLFEYDDNPVPYPRETLPFNYVFSDGSIGENNVTRQTLIDASETEFVTDYTYRYNSAGYPISLSRNGQEFTFSYSCEPTFREEGI